MAFIFTCGTHTFQSLLPGYENLTVQCVRCHNFTGKIAKRWQWFTFCFVPLIPFSLKPKHDIHCDICGENQPLEHRPDVQQQMGGAGGGAQQQIPMNNYGGGGGGGGGPPQGWNSQPQQHPQPVYK